MHEQDCRRTSMRTDSHVARCRASVAIALLFGSLSTTAAGQGLASTLDCVVLPDAEADVGSATPGVIASVLVERGEIIKAGQALAELESSIERAELALSSTRAELDADVALYAASAAYERRRLRRIETLHANHVVSSQERDKVDTETELAALRMRQAHDRKRLASLELARAQAALDQRTVRSPFDGVVVQQYKVAGEFVDEQPLLRIARLDPLRVEVIVPNELFGSVLPGMRAEVQQQMTGSPTHGATVRLIDPVGEPASGTFTISMVLPNPNLSILAGTRCTARLVPGSAPGSATSSAGLEIGPLSTSAPPTSDHPATRADSSADRHPPASTAIAVEHDTPAPPASAVTVAAVTVNAALHEGSPRPPKLASDADAEALPAALLEADVEAGECPPVVTASR